jgi:hypothetical protein
MRPADGREIQVSIRLYIDAPAPTLQNSKGASNQYFRLSSASLFTL